MDDGSKKLGRIVEIYEDKAVIQVFEGTENMSLLNTHTKLTGHPMEVELSADILEEPSTASENPLTAWVLLCRKSAPTSTDFP